MKLKKKYEDYIYEQNKDGSNRAGSYIKALSQLGAILDAKAPSQFRILDMWEVTQVKVVDKLYQYVLTQQNSDEKGIFHGTKNPSYWKNRFYSSALKSYAEFLRGDRGRVLEMNRVVKGQALKGVLDKISNVGYFNRSQYHCLLAGLSSKQFMILTGLSGSGKTKLSQIFVNWISPDSECYELIAVGADWTSNENLLGYPDALKEKSYRKPDNGALDLILRAIDNPTYPYFLILDEMNLSHVERYFADFLSAMESGELISLHDDTGADWNGVPAKLKIPINLFVIGTVNVDETTYMFSPKVLDRANVIEFRVSEEDMTAFLANPVTPDLGSIAGQGAGFAEAFVAAAKQKDVALDVATREAVSKVLMEFFPQLKEAGAEFGYRTAHEICSFIYFHKELSSKDWKIETAMDAAIMQKLLPKLHGSKKKLGPVLGALIRLCLKAKARPENDPIKDEVLVDTNALYPNSLEKLSRMRKRLAEHGFTSFAEA